MAEASSSTASQAIQNSQQEVWSLKDIHFGGQVRKIIMQNYNGPCSFIAVCNILILRGDIEILPRDRESASYELLSQHIADYIIKASPDVDISAALSILPVTQKGLDLNPLFTGAASFRPAGDGGALKLFSNANITLCHGWLVDPHSPEYDAVSKVGDYDNAVNAVVTADVIAKGQLVVARDEFGLPGPSGSGSSAGPSTGEGSSKGISGANGMVISGSETFGDGDRKKVEDALAIRSFLDSTSSQLTYYGLFTLASSLQPGSLVALLRNSHLSVLYKPHPAVPTSSSSSSNPNTSSDPSSSSDPADSSADSSLYTLVTDYIFYNEPSVVWERLEDVDGSSSTFVDADFRRSSPAGGDFAGHTAESALAAYEHANSVGYGFDESVNPADLALARQLQVEEDRKASEYLSKRESDRADRRAYRSSRPEENPSAILGRKEKKKKDCIIM